MITESTKEKVMAMTPAMMRFTLRGQGLSQKEVDAAVARLLDLQEGI